MEKTRKVNDENHAKFKLLEERKWKSCGKNENPSEKSLFRRTHGEKKNCKKMEAKWILFVKKPFEKSEKMVMKIKKTRCGKLIIMIYW